MFWVISVYFNIRNILPKSGTFLLGHPVHTPALILKILHFVHVVYSHIPYGSHSKQWFSYAEFIGFYNGSTLFSVRCELNRHIQYVNFCLQRAKEHMFFLGFQCTSYRFRDLIFIYFRLIQNYTFHHSSLQHIHCYLKLSRTRGDSCWEVRGKLTWNTEKLSLQWNVLAMIYNLIPVLILYGYMKSTPYRSTWNHCLRFYIFLQNILKFHIWRCFLTISQ